MGIIIPEHKFRSGKEEMSSGWTFLSSHGRVFEYVARHKQSSVEAMSREIGITQRAVFKIMKDLEKDGYITRKKIGRSNQYEIHSDLPMRHHMDHGRTVGEILPALKTELQHGGYTVGLI